MTNRIGYLLIMGDKLRLGMVAYLLVYCIVKSEPVGNGARVNAQKSAQCHSVYKTTKQTGEGEIQAKMYAILAFVTHDISN